MNMKELAILFSTANLMQTMRIEEELCMQNKQGENRYYTEEESKRVYEFVRSRYTSKDYDRSVKNFYSKALNTLCWIYEIQLDLNTFK